MRFGQQDVKRGGLEEIFIVAYKSYGPGWAKPEPSQSQAIVDGFGPAWGLSRLKPPQAKPKPWL